MERHERAGGSVLGWWRRRRLGDATRRRIVIALARAEERLVETHVGNALELLDIVGDELPLDQAVEIYLDSLDIPEPQASIVGRRVLARLEAGGRESGGRPGPDESGDKQRRARS